MKASRDYQIDPGLLFQDGLGYIAVVADDDAEVLFAESKGARCQPGEIASQLSRQDRALFPPGGKQIQRRARAFGCQESSAPNGRLVSQSISRCDLGFRATPMPWRSAMSRTLCRRGVASARRISCIRLLIRPSGIGSTANRSTRLWPSDPGVRTSGPGVLSANRRHIATTPSSRASRTLLARCGTERWASHA